jgi:hypothetical protein
MQLSEKTNASGTEWCELSLDDQRSVRGGDLFSSSLLLVGAALTAGVLGAPILLVGAAVAGYEIATQ